MTADHTTLASTALPTGTLAAAKVLWSEGMFLKPQHFQQQDRHVEHLIHQRCDALHGYGWGFSVLQIDRSLLNLGKLALTDVAGIMPDGTPFSYQGPGHQPVIKDITPDDRNRVVYLGVPLKRPGAREVGRTDSPQDTFSRYRSTQHHAVDAVTEHCPPATLEVAALNLQLLLETDDRSGFTCLPLARISDCQTDGRLTLDETFIPTTVNAHIVPRLHQFLKAFNGLVHHRATALCDQLTDTQRAGVAELSAHLMLQLLNRCQPLTDHWLTLRSLHPEQLYRDLAQLSGELATFTQTPKRPTPLQGYRHDNLQETFDPLMTRLQQQLSTVLEQAAIALPLKLRKYGIRVCTLPDVGLLDQANFVLSVRADLPTEQIRSRITAHTKMGTVERIRELVNAQLPGIGLTPLAVVPRQVPYHAGAVYFQLETQGEYWQELKHSGGLALHLGAELPDVQLGFWAIRQ